MRYRNHTALLLISIIAAFFNSGCEARSEEVAAPPAPKPPPQLEETVVPEAAVAGGDAVTKVQLALGEPRRLPDCHEIFEPMGALVDHFPIADEAGVEARVETMVGCDPEAYRIEADGGRYVAYALPEDARGASNLRFVKYAADGRLAWEATIDRSRQAANFAANFRDSFISLLRPRLACAGTMWEGGTQVLCARDESGEVAWSGAMPFWAGFAPEAVGDGLVVADLMALTRRYPYSGEEMAYTKLDGIGGRSALYVSDGEALYYSPGRAEVARLIKYDLESLKPVWRRELPGPPKATYRHVFPELDLLLLKRGDELVGVDTTTGDARWAIEVGEDHPSAAAHEGKLYLVHHRLHEPNQLLEIDPKTGEQRWAADLPGGTLKVISQEGVLLVKAVRAVQRVLELDAVAGAP